MIHQNEFLDEAAAYIKTFMIVSRDRILSDDVISTEAKVCAALITSLARSTDFTPYSDDDVARARSALGVAP